MFRVKCNHPEVVNMNPDSATKAKYVPDPPDPEIESLSIDTPGSTVEVTGVVWFPSTEQATVTVSYEWTDGGEIKTEADSAIVNPEEDDIKLEISSVLSLLDVYTDDGLIDVRFLVNQDGRRDAVNETVDVGTHNGGPPDNGDENGNGDDPDPPDTAGPSTELLLALAAVIVLFLVYGYTR